MFLLLPICTQKNATVKFGSNLRLQTVGCETVCCDLAPRWYVGMDLQRSIGLHGDGWHCCPGNCEKTKHVIVEADGFERKGPTTSKKCNSFGYPSSHFRCELGGKLNHGNYKPRFYVYLISSYETFCCRGGCFCLMGTCRTDFLNVHSSC